MPKIPSVQRNIPEPQLNKPLATAEQWQGDQSVSNAISFASEATAQYAIEEKRQFDLARLTEARNILDVRETQLSSDEKNGYQNKLGQNAVLFKDDEGNDFMTHYSNRYQEEIQDIETQLQLTPDQKKLFSDYAQQKAVSFNNSLMTHQLRQGKEYKVSVFENAVKIASTKAQGQFTNFGEMDETIEQMTADMGALGQELGWSDVEKSQKVSEAVNAIHANNTAVMIESGDFATAEAYVKQYGNKMSQLQKISTESKIKKMKDDFITAQFIKLDTQAMTGGSNPAFNSNDMSVIKATSVIDPSEFSTLKYSDPRLDSLVVLKAKEEGLEWAIPLVTALRVSGEKSNNSAVSPAGAKGVYQFMPIAVEQIRQITGKTIDPNNPEQATWGALKFVEWISKKYNTQDTATIASYYNGGGNHIPQMRSGGVSAIKNKENRDYVSRILAFDFNTYAHNPISSNGLNMDLANVTPENQAKILANRDRIHKQQKQELNERKDLAYQNASDMIILGQASYEQLIKNKDIVKFLDANQLNSLKSIDKAKRSEDSADLVAKIYQNPSKLKGMGQKEFDLIISYTTDSDKKELSKMYAQANGRTIADAKDAQKAGSKTIVTNKLVFDIVGEYGATVGFSGTSSSTKKIQNSNKDSAMFMAIKDEMFKITSVADDRYFATNGKRMTEFQIRNFIKNQFGREISYTKGWSSGKESVYSAETTRSQVSDQRNDIIVKLARQNGKNYANVKQMSDSEFWTYYYKSYNMAYRRR